MKMRLVAAVLGMVLFSQAAVQPAKADANWDSYVDMGIELLISFIDKAENGIDDIELLQLTQELRAALSGVKADLYAHVDELAVADIKAQVRYTINNVGMLNVASLRGSYVNSVAIAAANAREKLAVFGADANRDTVARAMIAEYQTLLVGQARVGMPPAYAEYKEALAHAIASMQPRCSEFLDPKLGSITHSCDWNGRTVTGIQRMGTAGYAEVSYDGGVTWSRNTLDRGYINTKVMEQTAQELARRALLELIEGGH